MIQDIESNQVSATFMEKLNSCIHCGMCLPACPTYRVTGSETESPRGRIYLMRAYLEGRIEDPKKVNTHLDRCLGCMGCVTACPSGVDYHHLLMTTREKLVVHQPGWKRLIRRTLLRYVLPHTRRLSLVATWLQRLQHPQIMAMLRQPSLQSVLPDLSILSQLAPAISKPNPIIPQESYRFGANEKGRVALFVGCVMNVLFDQTHRHTIQVLVANGYEVVIPQQTCCGALAYHAGEVDIARELAKTNLDFLLDQDLDMIVVNSAGCGSTLKEYPELLSQSNQAEGFKNKVVDVMELLAQHPLQGAFQKTPLKVAYHAACHLHHAQKIQQQPYDVLKQLPGVSLVPLSDAEFCCGSAGVYNLAHPQMSWEILQLKMAGFAQLEADCIVSANPGCLLQLQAGLNASQIPFVLQHPIDLIAQRYESLTPLTI